MVPATLPRAHDTPSCAPTDGPTPPSARSCAASRPWRNALSVGRLYVQTAAVLVATVAWGPWSWPFTFLLMGRAHRAVRVADARGGAPPAVRRTGGPTTSSAAGCSATRASRSTDALPPRRTWPTTARSSGPDEPDMPLYRGYPIAADSFRRKLVRDATGRTGVKLMRGLFRGAAQPRRRGPAHARQIVAMQVVLLAAAIAVRPLVAVPVASGWPRTSPCGASSTGCARSPSTAACSARRTGARPPTRCASRWPARFALVPYNIGWHLAHHVD